MTAILETGSGKQGHAPSDKQGSVVPAHLHRLLSRHPGFIKSMLEHNYPFTADEIDRLKKPHWPTLSANGYLPWSNDFIARYQNHWDWHCLSTLLFDDNSFVTTETIRLFTRRWDWTILTLYMNGTNIKFDLPFAREFAKHLSWEDVVHNSPVEWSFGMVEAFGHKWGWSALSACPGLLQTPGAFERYFDHWDWRTLSANHGLPWTTEFIRQHLDYLDWQGLSSNPALPWSMEFIQRFKRMWNWKKISSNTGLPWSPTLISELQDVLDWKALSANQYVPWTLGLTESLHDKVDWESLSSNHGAQWSPEFIARFADQWNWSSLATNESIQWTPELMIRHADRLPLNDLLCSHYSAIWSTYVVEANAKHLDWNMVSSITKMDWTEDFLLAYEDRLHWDALASNQTVWERIFDPYGPELAQTLMTT